MIVQITNIINEINLESGEAVQIARCVDSEGFMFEAIISEQTAQYILRGGEQPASPPPPTVAEPRGRRAEAVTLQQDYEEQFSRMEAEVQRAQTPAPSPAHTAPSNGVVLHAVDEDGTEQG